MKPSRFFILLYCLFVSNLAFAQTAGIIVRPAGTSGPVILDPNGDGYTSKSTGGFNNDDLLNSEIAYKTLLPVSPEPTGDVLRGPSGKYSDIVKTLDGSGFYLYNDGTNLLCRIRMGGIVSGSKGYSFLVDTDAKFGATGPTADPNYRPATNGNNGNPGFELEIVFESNFRVAVYNVDGTSTPGLLNSYPINTNSQISVAATTDGGDPDYFYDFFVPFSALGINASTPIRTTATTVMSPQPAIGGPKSDIYGLSGTDYMSDWTTAVLSQPPFSFNDLTPSGPGVGPSCTAPPVLNSPVVPTATTVTGTWTKSPYSALTSALVTLYKGSTVIGTTTVTSGSGWSINVTGLANNDVLTAKAQAIGESMCLASNAVSVNACNASNRPPAPVLSCTSGSKGINGTNYTTGWTINVDNLTRNTFTNSVTNVGALFGANTGTSPAITWQYSGGCSTGSPLTSGSYKIYYTDNVTGCVSAPAYFCAAGNGPNTLAGSLAITISSPTNGVYTPATTSVAGTTTAGAMVSLYINDQLSQTTTASAGGVFNFSGLSLSTGQQLYYLAELNTGTVGTSYCAVKSAAGTVTCYTDPPIITIGNASQLVAGSPITGTSVSPAGTLVKIYTGANLLVATAVVQSNGTWSTGTAGTTPAIYNAVSGTSYYALAQNGTCSASSASATFTTTAATSAARCGSLPATVSENAASVSGTLSGTSLAGTIVTLYQDGYAIGTYSTANNAWGPISINTTASNTIYSGAVLTIGITEPTKNEVICPGSVTITCAVPAAPSVSPGVAVILVGETVTFTVSSPQAGILYSIRDTLDSGNQGTSKFGSGSSITLQSDTFRTVGDYTLKVKATSFSGNNCLSSTALKVYVTFAPLRVSLVSFTGKVTGDVANLQWQTALEQNLGHFELEESIDGKTFTTLAKIPGGNTNNSGQQYRFSDSGKKASFLFYRLKMTDKSNLAVQYSNTIILGDNRGAGLQGVRPNPFSEELSINLHVNTTAPIYLSLSDLAGRKIRLSQYNATPGMNSFSLHGLGALIPGTYLLEVNSGAKLLARKMVIKN